LRGRVEVIRDRHGMAHVYASDAGDAFRVQGYQMARDRAAQLELLRRQAGGTLGEVVGGVAAAVRGDVVMRAIGLRHVAERAYEATGGDERAWLEAFADGVSQYNERLRSGAEALPADVAVLLPASSFGPWSAVDVLMMQRFQEYGVSFIDFELALTDFVARVRAAFDPTSDDAPRRLRSGLAFDANPFAPLDPTTVMPPRPAGAASRGAAAFVPGALPPSALGALGAWREHFARQRGPVPAYGKLGSNHWGVMPSRSATGHALHASDPHLPLTSPNLGWPVHLVVRPGPEGADASAPGEPLFDVAGLAFAGTPGVTQGFNRHVAWGPTVAYLDAADVYLEQVEVDPATGRLGVRFRGAVVPFETRAERVDVAGGAPIEYEQLIVPHHGPLMTNFDGARVVPPRPGETALSVRWTGERPGRSARALFDAMRARDVFEAEAALGALTQVPLNWLVADVAGNLLYFTSRTAPARAKGAFAWDAAARAGTLPCLALPGDGSAEWGPGALPDGAFGRSLNPASGYALTANNDHFGATLDNDPSNDVLPDGTPVFYTCKYDAGQRAGRIDRLLAEAPPRLSLDDLGRMQADARSQLGALVVPALLASLERASAAARAPGATADAALAALVASDRFARAPLAEARADLEAWRDRLGFRAAAGVDLDAARPSADADEATASRATLLFHTWLLRLTRATFRDEFEAAGLGGRNPLPAPLDLGESTAYLLTTDPTRLATYDAARGDSVVFDDLNTPQAETRDERVVTALLDALDALAAQAGPDRNAWRWGNLHRVRFNALVPLWFDQSIPSVSDDTFPDGFPRAGDTSSVDVAGHDPYPAGEGAAADQLSFNYRHGPVYRVLVDLDPAGPRAKLAVAGGSVSNPTSRFFRDGADLWRKNEYYDVPFERVDVERELDRGGETTAYRSP
jgi:penicillin amidase